MYLKKYNLKNKTAIVTGAGKGLGRACAIALAEAGAKVILLSRTKSDLDKLEKDIKKTKSKLIKIHCDVMDYSDLSEKLKKVKFIDVLVNNAGTNLPEPFEKVKQQSMNYLIDLNLKSAFNVAQLVVKKMLTIILPHAPSALFLASVFIIRISKIIWRTPKITPKHHQKNSSKVLISPESPSSSA